MTFRVQIATKQSDVLRCQYLIADVYNKEYEVMFSSDRYDLDAKVEPWPHRYLMLLEGDVLAATLGLYLHDTYVQRFGAVTQEDFTRVLGEASSAGAYDPTNLREVTKIVVARPYRGRGLARYIVGCAHSTAFLQGAEARMPLVVFCAKRSIANKVHQAVGLRPRLLKPFPNYKVHELYRSESDPMDSYLIVPHLDIPARWRALDLPCELEASAFHEVAS